MDDATELRFPLLVSPSLSGVRCCLTPDFGPVGHNRRAIPNPYVRGALKSPGLYGLDGVLVVGRPFDRDVLSRTIAGIIADRRPVDWHFYVFDDFSMPEVPLKHRLWRLERRLQIELPSLKVGNSWLQNVIHSLPHRRAHDERSFASVCEEFASQGAEGALVRDPDASYYFGRPRVRSQIALEIRFAGTMIRTGRRQKGLAYC